MKKRILSALLTSCMVLTLLPVSALAAPANETGAQFSNTATSEQEQKEIIMNIQFICDDEVVKGGDFFVPAGVQNYSVLKEYVPEGYQMTASGDFMAEADATLAINVEKIAPEAVIMNIQFKCGDEVIAGGDYFVPAGVQNYSVLEQYVPTGYRMTVSGDFMAEQNGKLEIGVEKVMADTDVIMNIAFKTADGTFVAGGDYFVPAGVQNYSVLKQYVPEGYEMTVSGDFMAEDGGKLVVNIEKISTDVIMNIRFVTVDGEFVAGGDYFVPAGVQNYFVLKQYVPEGYEMTVSGDFTVTAGGQEDITVEKISEDVIMNIRFVTVDGEFVAGGDYFLPEGIQNMSILEQYVPEGYKMMESGDFTVTAGGQEDITVEKINKDVIMNIRFVLADGTFVAGGDYFLPEGIQNMSILEQYVPEGYKMMESGDFTVTAGGQEDITVEKISEDVIMNIRFVTVDGEFVAGGDYFLPEGIQNFEILEQYLPEGFKLMEFGDFFVTDGGKEDVTVEEIKSTIPVNVRYWDTVNNTQVGESFTITVDADATSVNTSTFKDIPAGYELVWTGDLPIVDGWVWVEVRPVDAETKTVGLNYWDIVNNKQVAEGSLTVAADATMVNTSTFKDIPAGYELVWTGDLPIVDGWVWVEVRPVTAPPVEKTFTVTFDSNGGSKVASQTVKEGEKVAKPANPTLSGYTFEGWFVDKALKTAYDFNTPVTSDITLYASWDRRSSGGGGGGGSSSTKKYIITVTCGEGGEITPDGGSDNEVEVRKGNDQTFRISADNGYRISDVLVDGESVGNVDKYTFEDVDEDHEIEAIFTRRAADPSDSGTDRYLNTKDHVQYMTGYPDGSFGPGQNMTRAEAAQMFYALLLDQNVPHTVSFSDVPADAWYAEAVNTLASLGMINGYPDGTFRPDAPITRAEFCVIALAFAYEPEDFDCNFRDVSTSDWFYDYVAQATSYGWISGADRSFRPNECITRAEVSVIVNNMLGRAADEDYIDRHEDELNTFPDVKPSHWAYYSIMETANSHDYTKNNGNENWR